MPKLVNNIGKVFHKYSFIAHILNAVSAVGMVALAPFPRLHPSACLCPLDRWLSCIRNSWKLYQTRDRRVRRRFKGVNDMFELH